MPKRRACGIQKGGTRQDAVPQRKCVANRRSQIVYEFGPHDIGSLVSRMNLSIEGQHDWNRRRHVPATGYRDINENQDEYNKTLILKGRVVKGATIWSTGEFGLKERHHDMLRRGCSSQRSPEHIYDRIDDFKKNGAWVQGQKQG